MFYNQDFRSYRNSYVRHSIYESSSNLEHETSIIQDNVAINNQWSDNNNENNDDTNNKSNNKSDEETIIDNTDDDHDSFNSDSHRLQSSSEYETSSEIYIDSITTDGILGDNNVKSSVMLQADVSKSITSAIVNHLILNCSYRNIINDEKTDIHNNYVFIYKTDYVH